MLRYVMAATMRSTAATTNHMPSGTAKALLRSATALSNQVPNIGGNSSTALLMSVTSPPSHTARMAAQLALREDIPADCSTPQCSQLRQLLTMYQDALDTVDSMRWIPMVLWKHRGRLHYLPRAKWPVHYFVLRHIRKTLNDLNRCYSGRAALGRAAECEEQDREAARDFEQSLPRDRHPLYMLALIAAVAVLLQLIIRGLLRVLSTGETSQGRETISMQLLGAVNDIAKLANPSMSSVTDAVNDVLSGRLGPFVMVTVVVLLVGFVVLRPVVPAFRLKRMLFNLAAEAGGSRPSAVARWSDSQATGVYECEHRVFAALGARPPKEFPFDLALSVVALVVPAAYGVSALVMAVSVPADIATILGDLLPAIRAVWLITGLFTVGVVLLRLAWLRRTWRRRRFGRAWRYLSYEVGIRAGQAAAKVENPCGVRLLISLLPAAVAMSYLWDPNSGGLLTAVASFAWGTGVLIHLSWWYRINRELRDLDSTYDSGRASSRRVGSVLLMALGSSAGIPVPGMPIFSLIAIFGFGRRIRRAQTRAGQRMMVLPPWILVIGMLVPPVVFAYVQKELNRLWVVEGQPLDPWPAAVGSEASPSTAPLPWLKTKPLHNRSDEPGRVTLGGSVVQAASVGDRLVTAAGPGESIPVTSRAHFPDAARQPYTPVVGVSIPSASTDVRAIQ
jgi:hypothetical protein